MSEYASKVNVMKEEFGWDIPYEAVPLPSRGVLYNPDCTLYNAETLQIKAMTAQEEDILTSPAFIKEGSTIDNLIKSCLVDKTIDPLDLTIGDRNALMISIRITGYGSDYNMTHSCQYCNRQNKIVAQLSELGIKRMTTAPIEQGKNLFSFVLPVTKKTVQYKLQTCRDEKEAEITNRRMKDLGVNVDNTVTSYLQNTIVSVDGITDKNKLSHFIKNMPARDSRVLRLHMQENEPGIDMSWEYQCDGCKTNNTIKLPITTEFFWPST